MGFLDRPTRRLTRRSVDGHLSKEFEARRSSELEGDGPTENIFKPKKLTPMPTSENQHVDGLFLDKSFSDGCQLFCSTPR